MKTHVLMTKLSPEVSRQIKDRATIGRAWLDQVREKCPEVNLSPIWLFWGRTIFLIYYEAPDEETAAKVSMVSMANGAMSAEKLKRHSIHAISGIDEGDMRRKMAQPLKNRACRFHQSYYVALF